MYLLLQRRYRYDIDVGGGNGHPVYMVFFYFTRDNVLLLLALLLREVPSKL